MTITEFLTARYDEEEADVLWDNGQMIRLDLIGYLNRGRADIAAKRAIVALYESSGLRIAMGQVVRLLAQPYAEHADFDESWKL